MHGPIRQTVRELLMLGDLALVQRARLTPGRRPRIGRSPPRHGFLISLERLARAIVRHLLQCAHDARPVGRIEQHVTSRRHRRRRGHPLRRRRRRTGHDKRVRDDEPIESKRVAQIAEYRFGKRRGRAGRIPRRIGDVGRHHAGDAGLHGGRKRRAVGLLELRRGNVYDGQALVRIGRRAAVSREVLGTREHAVLLAAADPRRRVRADDLRIGAERPGLHDRILRLDVQIADGRERPGETDSARFGARDLPARIRRIEIVEVAEGGGGRQLGEALHLLPRPALEVRAEQQRPAGDVAQRTRERGDRVARAAEENESADAGREGGVNGGTIGPERTTSPAQRRTDETRAPFDHGGVTCPNTRGPRAPVAAGRLPGFPITVSRPRNAKATASFASPSKKSCSNSTTGRGCTLAASRSTSAGFFAPPPEITSSALESSVPQRAIARPMVSAVKAVAVATASLSEPPAFRTRASSLSAYSMPNRSRPVLFGGGSSKYGSASSSSSSFAIGRPRRARSPSRSYDASGSTLRVTASMTATPGPVSNA